MGLQLNFSDLEKKIFSRDMSRRRFLGMKHLMCCERGKGPSICLIPFVEFFSILFFYIFLLKFDLKLNGCLNKYFFGLMDYFNEINLQSDEIIIKIGLKQRGEKIKKRRKQKN